MLQMAYRHLWFHGFMVELFIGRMLKALSETSLWPFGRSGCVNHVTMQSLESVVGIFLRQIQKISSTNPKEFINKSKTFRRPIQKSSSTNPKNFVEKSKKVCRQIQKKLSTNPKKFVNKSKKNCQKSKTNPEIQKSRNPKLHFLDNPKTLENPVVLTSESHL